MFSCHTLKSTRCVPFFFFNFQREYKNCILASTYLRSPDRHDAVCVSLPHPRAGPVSGPALSAVCDPLERSLEGRILLGRLGSAVRLAPRPHGVRAAGSLWLWYVI